MRAVILADGLGIRLSEEIALRPKPLDEIGRRTVTVKSPLNELANLHAHIVSLSERYAELAQGPKEFVAGISSVPPAGKVLGDEALQPATRPLTVTGIA